MIPGQLDIYEVLDLVAAEGKNQPVGRAERRSDAQPRNQDLMLACPQCGSVELATVEDLTGSAYGYAEIDAAGERTFVHEGWTEVYWDSSESKAVECRDCGWQQEATQDGPNLDELKAPDGR